MAMQIATFAISVLAVIAAGFSALSAHRSASAAKRAAARDPWELNSRKAEVAGQWLKNTSRRTAFDVRMTPAIENPALRLDNVPEGETIHAGAIRVLNIGFGVTSLPYIVTVRWRERPGGAEMEWTTGL
jgi:hypothetical protein